MRMHRALRLTTVVAGLSLTALALSGAAPASPSVISSPEAAPAAPVVQAARPSFTAKAGLPGLFNAITDVPGVRVGQVHNRAAPFLTGTSVVYFPRMSVASADQRGGAPATKETDLLSPLNSNPGVNAIQLGGSSMYGLSATDGIIRWLENKQQGVPLGSVGVAPIVPAADIYDLGRGGDIKARTTPEWGYVAAASSADGPVRQGAWGGGTGARTGGLKGGVGTASVYLGDGVYVGAVVIVNSAGSPIDPATCELLGARLGIGGEFGGLKKPWRGQCENPKSVKSAESTASKSDDLNTTIAVVATNAPLEKAAAQRMSGNAHDGMARAIRPIHTLYDGDTVFAVSTGQGTPLRINDPAASSRLNAIFGAGADTLSRAIAKAVLAADSTGGISSYCDRYPSACANLPQAATWRTDGSSTEMTRRLFDRANTALKVTPLPR